MLIILEGPNGSGKTTLAGQLQTYLSVKYPSDVVTLIHRGPPTSHPLDEYVLPLLDYRPGRGEHIICDRWHLGEVVYPSIVKRPTQLNIAVRFYIEQFLQSRGAVTYVMATSIRDCLDRLHSRGEFDEDDDQTIPREFVSFASARLGSPTSISCDPIPASIAAYARRAEDAAFRLNGYVTPVGTPQPTLMVVGDTRICGGGKCTHRVRHPENSTCFMPYPGTSGEYLFDAYRRGRALFVNACDVDDVEKLWIDVGQPHVTVLGRRAQRQVGFITPAVAPHPQYVRRFHHAHASEYGSLIRVIEYTSRDEGSWRPS